jgi:hypothetical protein
MQLGMLATFRLQFPRRGQGARYRLLGSTVPTHLLTRLLWRSPGRVEQTRNMPPRYALRLDDLRPWHLIVATCAACGRRAHVAAALLQHRRPRTPGCSTLSGSSGAPAVATVKATR